MSLVSEARAGACEPLLTPAALLDELPLGDALAAAVDRARAEVRAVLAGVDDRLLAVVGPCSAPDREIALDYAGRLAQLRDRYAADLLVVMRVNFKRINGVGMDGGHEVHRGLRLTRRLLLDVLRLGLPVGLPGDCEWLDPITPQYLADAVTWGAVGTGTTESPVHRQMASGSSMSVGFEIGADADVQVAVDACRAAAVSHTFFGVTYAGAAALVTTAGNPDTHVILHGGRSDSGYPPECVTKALNLLGEAGLPRRVVVDAGHGNSRNDAYQRQAVVARAVADQVAGGQHGLAGITLKSSLHGVRQEHGGATLEVFRALADAVRERRSQ